MTVRNQKGRRHVIPCAEIEYVEGGNTLWVHGRRGGTILRIKVMGGITTKVCETAPEAHLDLVVNEPAVMCVPKNVRRHLVKLSKLEKRIAKIVGLENTTARAREAGLDSPISSQKPQSTRARARNGRKSK